MNENTETALTVRNRAAIERYQPANFEELWDRSRLFAVALNLTPEAAAVKALYGIELGLTVTQACAGVHLVPTKEGTKVVVSAEVLRAVVLRHLGADVEVFSAKRTSATECCWVAKRRGAPEVEVTWTLEDADRAGLLRKQVWQAHPRQMLAARASAEAARLVFPDLVAGFYSSDEIDPAQPAPPPSSTPVATVAPQPPKISSAQAVLAAARAVAEEPKPAPPPVARTPQPEPDVVDVEVVESKPEPEPKKAKEPTPTPQHVADAHAAMRRALAEAGADLGEERAAWVARRWTEGPRRLRKSDSPDLAKAKVAELGDALLQAVDELAAVHDDAARVAGEEVSS